MTGGADAMASPVRRSIVETLQRFAAGGQAADTPVGVTGMTAAQLATELGLHVTTVRFHLDQLEAAGAVTSDFTAVFGVGRPRKVFSATNHLGDRPAVTSSHHRLLAELLTSSFSSGLSPEQLGERWAGENVHVPTSPPASSPGQWLAKIGLLIDVLRQWGYSTNIETSDGGRSCRIDLFDCPFMDLAQTNPEVVCGIHRGLLAGTLRQLGESQTDVSLRPFIEPKLCHAHITTKQRFESQREESSHES